MIPEKWKLPCHRLRGWWHFSSREPCQLSRQAALDCSSQCVLQGSFPWNPGSIKSQGWSSESRLIPSFLGPELTGYPLTFPEPPPAFLGLAWSSFWKDFCKTYCNLWQSSWTPSCLWVDAALTNWVRILKPWRFSMVPERQTSRFWQTQRACLPLK